MAFLNRAPVGHGGKLLLFVFNDDDYEKLEEEADQCDGQDELTAFLDKLLTERKICKFAEIDIESLWVTILTTAWS